MGKILKIFLNPFIPSVYHLSFLTCATVNCQNVFYVLVQIIIRNIQQDGGKQTSKNKNIKCNSVPWYWTLVLDWQFTNQDVLKPFVNCVCLCLTVYLPTLWFSFLSTNILWRPIQCPTGSKTLSKIR